MSLLSWNQPSVSICYSYENSVKTALKKKNLHRSVVNLKKIFKC